MYSKDVTTKPDFNEACGFIIKLGEKIHGYGPNAARLEWYLNRITKVFGYQGVFRSTPNQISFAFSETKGPWQKMHVSAMNGTGTDLDKMAKVGDLIDSLKNGTVSITEASKRLDEIDKLPHPWGNVSMAISYMLCGVAFPVLMGGSWWDLVLSGIFSLVVFIMVMKSGSRGPLSADWLPLSTAFVAGILAGIAKFYLPEINVVLIVLSAVLILVPGYPTSVGVIEIVSNHIGSGISNLVNGLIYLFKQVIGGWIGYKVVSLILVFPATTTATSIDPQWLWLFMPLLIIGLGIALQTPYRDFFWTCIAMVIAYGGILLGSDLIGSNFGNLLGTILLVLFTNTWARTTGRPPSIVLVPAFVLLVSGSIGFRGLAAFATGNMQTGEQQFMQMFIVALTLAAGLVIGVTLLKPESSK